jgi:hypothetical protein
METSKSEWRENPKGGFKYERKWKWRLSSRWDHQVRKDVTWRKNTWRIWGGDAGRQEIDVEAWLLVDHLKWKCLRRRKRIIHPWICRPLLSNWMSFYVLHFYCMSTVYSFPLLNMFHQKTFAFRGRNLFHLWSVRSVGTESRMFNLIN